MEMNERLKELRKHYLRLSQKEMAEKTNLKEYKLRDIEIGKLNLSIDVVDKIVHNFNINTNWLLFGEGEVFLKKNESTQKKIINNDNGTVNVNSGGKGTFSSTNTNNYNSIDNSNDNRINELINIYKNLPPIEQEKAYHRLKLQSLEVQH